ncbi:hypothetical protein K7X08_032356 [Anisodus acutangulus]|uniref:Uncharacterized protein n=1 Tax=Anisodus acutangulus TaxID=402998 RepID=A0A9Q1M3J6_9SOLA|nr:hypothetical protein K7X08_032356 [Anisodus acutangulus]
MVVTYPGNTKGKDKKMDADKGKGPKANDKEVCFKNKFDVLNQCIKEEKNVDGKNTQHEELGEVCLYNVDHSQGVMLPSLPSESEIQSHCQLMVSVNDKGVGSYPHIRKEFTQELHEVVSRNIDFYVIDDLITKDVAGDSKNKENAGDENVHKVLQHVAREAGISPKSMQKGNKKMKKQSASDAHPTRTM